MRDFAELFSTANTTASEQIFCRYKHEDAHLGIPAVFQLPPLPTYLTPRTIGKPLVHGFSVLSVLVVSVTGA